MVLQPLIVFTVQVLQMIALPLLDMKPLILYFPSHPSAFHHFCSIPLPQGQVRKKPECFSDFFCPSLFSHKMGDFFTKKFKRQCCFRFNPASGTDSDGPQQHKTAQRYRRRDDSRCHNDSRRADGTTPTGRHSRSGNTCLPRPSFLGLLYGKITGLFVIQYRSSLHIPVSPDLQ